MNKIVPAGGISKRAVEMNQQDREALLRIRTYQADDDVNRDIEYKDAKNRIVRISLKQQILCRTKVTNAFTTRIHGTSRRGWPQSTRCTII
jgi:hypothetical protein